MPYDLDLLRSIAAVEPDPNVTEYRGRSTAVSPVSNAEPYPAPAASPSLELARLRREHPPVESHTHGVVESPPSVLGEADADLGPQP